MAEQSNSPKSLENILSNFGISSDFVQKVRFRGPVGKLALLGIVALAVLGGVGVRTSDPVTQLASEILATCVTLLIAGAILWYSHAHPDQATLEGMEVVVMQQQKALAAKGLSLPDNVPVIPNPQGVPPELNPPMEPDK